MTGFDDQAFAAGMRDVIVDIAGKRVDQMRPESKIAQVVTIDPAKYTCTVLFAGEDASNTITVRCPTNLVPRLPGDMVRVRSNQGIYYVESFLSGVPTIDSRSPLSKTPRFISRRASSIGPTAAGWANGTVGATAYVWNPSDIIVPAGATIANITWNNRARAGNNAAGYWSLFVLRDRTAAYEFFDQHRVHNDGDQFIDLGTTISAFFDVSLDVGHTIGFYVNVDVDSGGVGFTPHMSHFHVSFMGTGV